MRIRKPKRNGAIGIFDSGLGGLFVMKKIVKLLPEYDYIYLGDTARVPYGNRSRSAICKFTEEAVSFLFQRGAAIIIIACNSSSAVSLRHIQKNYLKKHYPDRRVLGVIAPTVEAALEENGERIGVLATAVTVSSGVYAEEIKKRNPNARVFERESPLLVSLIEYGGLQWCGPIVKQYVGAFRKKNIDTLLLGCTHYPILKKHIMAAAGKRVRVISQDDIIPAKLWDYLDRHAEIMRMIGKNARRQFLVTDITDNLSRNTGKWFGRSARLKKVRYY